MVCVSIGLLSDEGLYELSSGIGFEWPQLATLLKICKAEQEQLRMSYPNDAKHLIVEMLRKWRDEKAVGEKEQVG